MKRLVAGENITFTVNEETKEVTVDATGGGGEVDPAAVREEVADQLVAGSNVTLSVNPTTKEIEISATGGGGGDPELRGDLEEAGATITGYVPVGSGVSGTTVQAKLIVVKDMVNDFGADKSGATSAKAAFNKAIAYANANGSANANDGLCFSFLIPDGVYDLRTMGTGLDALTVANVRFYHHGGAWLLLKDGPVFVLGTTSAFQDNFYLSCNTYTAPADVPNSTNTLVKGVYHARCTIIIDCIKLSHPYSAAPADGKFVGNINIDVGGTGIVDRHFIDIDLGAYTPGMSSAGLKVRLRDVYAKDVTGAAMPLNPYPLPHAITNITAATPPVVTTAVNHGFTTGMRVAIRSTNGGTHPANGALPDAGETMGADDYLVTVLSSTTFSLQNLSGTNINGSGWPAFSGTGFVTQRHFSFAHQKALIRVKGPLDTTIVTGIGQHWANFMELELTTGTSTSFVDFHDFYADYIGSSHLFVKCEGGHLSDVRLSDGWIFTLDHDAVRYTYDPLKGGTIKSMTASNVRSGLLGGVVFNDYWGISRKAKIADLELRSCVRSRGGNPNALFFGGTAANPVIDGFEMMDPDLWWGAGFRPAVLPHCGVNIPAAAMNCRVSGCEVDVRSGGQFYSIPAGGNKAIYGNRCADGSIPEYARKTAITVTGSPFTWTNQTGGPVRLSITGGTVSLVEVGDVGSLETYFTATNQRFEVARGEAVKVTYSSTPTMAYRMLSA